MLSFYLLWHRISQKSYAIDIKTKIIKSTSQYRKRDNSRKLNTKLSIYIKHFLKSNVFNVKHIKGIPINIIQSMFTLFQVPLVTWY